MRNILLIIANILRVTFRKKGNIIVYLFLPLAGVVLSILIYGNSGTSPLRVGIINNDNGVLSADLEAALQNSNTYKIYDIKESEVKDKLLDMELAAAIIVPDGYSDSIYKGSPISIEVMSVKGQDTTMWVTQMLNSYTDTLYKLSVAAAGDRAAFDNLYGQYKSKIVRLSVVKLEDKRAGQYIALSTIGFLIMFIMLGASLINMIILKEKRDRTYHRICAAPVNAGQFIAGNAITSLLIVTAQILIIQLVMKFLLRIDTGVGDTALFVILLMFGLVAIGIGLVVTAFSSSSYMASTLSTLIITPTSMLGGCYWSIDLMPDFMQKISYYVPQRWAINAIQKLQAGGGQGDILINLLILAAFAGVLMLIAIYRFSRSGNPQKFV